ncbi:MAG: DinB family protein [Ginsengibacter sp.]
MNITNFFERDLDKLIEEINLFKNEKDIWKTKEGINNSAGNLTMHLLGNLNHFIGKNLANTDYIRKRDEEFTIKNIPREKLISHINSLKEIIKNTLPNLSEEDLKKQFPLKIQEQTFTTGNMLTFLLLHLNYHLGQINYLRRLL